MIVWLVVKKNPVSPVFRAVLHVGATPWKTMFLCNVVEVDKIKLTMIIQKSGSASKKTCLVFCVCRELQGLSGENVL